MISGVSLIHQGPCGADWIPSRIPDWHQAAMVDTFTLSKSAATSRNGDHPLDIPRPTPLVRRDSHSGME